MSTKSREARIKDVRAAHRALAGSIRAAVAAEKAGKPAATVEALWELVEMEGATIHRQSRLLAGKSRGG